MPDTRLPNQTTYEGKLIIFTTFYESRCLAQYAQSMVCTSMVLERLGIKWDYWPVFGEFHVERAVNETYTRFMNDPEATDILTIDSDESWDPAIILRLLAHKEPVVGCSYKMKNRWDSWTALLKHKDGVPAGKTLADGSVLIEAERLPGGFLRLKKEVLERYRDYFTDRWYNSQHGKTHIFCELEYRDRTMFSQDFGFSERLKELGYQLWCDPTAIIAHYGITGHAGCLDQYYRDLKAAEEEEAKLGKARAIVADMAADIESRQYEAIEAGGCAPAIVATVQ